MSADAVAFFRNLNVGQQRSPSTAQLLAAFADEGAVDVLSHQSNGTVAFASPGREPTDVVLAVVDRVAEVSAWDDVALVRPVSWLRQLHLEELPDGCELTLVDGPDPFPVALPHHSERAAATILAADHLHAIVHNHVESRSNGTPLVEHLLGGTPATSRGTGTVLRLLDRLGAA
jgi:hypothetical protein